MITLEQAKSHLRVDHDDEDEAIEHMVAAALDHVRNHTGAAFPADEDLPPPVRAAALMIVADLFDSRQAPGSEYRPTSAALELLAPYRLELGV